MQKLEEEFLASGGKWKEFLIEDLFEKLDLKFKKKKFNKAEDISQKRTKEFDLPLVNAKNGDNGIMYYGRSTDFESAEMTIDIVNDGAVSTGNVYPQPQRTGVLYNAYLIKAKQNVSKVSLSFLSTAIQKSIKLKFGYENKAGWEKVKKEYISLPSLDDNPAYFYMDSFITELQAERLQELQGYLQVTGLSNYTLTEEEQRAIEGLKSTVEQEMFTMQDIFRITTSAKKFNAKDLSFDGIYPYVARTEKDNGIRGYITEDKKYLNPENTISFGQDTATMFYQKNAYFTGDKIKIFSLKNKILNRSIALYLITRMKKSFSVFSWGSMFNEEVLNKTEVYLPINNGQIDYSKMELIISAVQKLVIADVVKYADRELSAYQNVIGE